MKKIPFADIQLGRVLGTGTVGTVYQGTLKDTGQEVAVKVLQEAISDDELVRKRFRREMSILAKLDHPHIIRYYGGGETDDGRLFFAMDLLDGGNVRDLLERFGHLAWYEVASIGRQAASALQAAHNNGIIHRDLKPRNLFLDSNGKVKLGDFGIARDTRSADITSQGMTVGTHAYMSPEQIQGKMLTNGKTDLYSLGCVLYELITGTKPFEGPNFAVLFEQHLHRVPSRVDALVPDCPAQLADIIALLLEKNPDRRPFNARAVQGILNEMLVAADAPALVDSHSSSGQDVSAASVVDYDLADPGMGSLSRKLQVESRPSFSWGTIAVLALVVLIVITLASFSAG